MIIVKLILHKYKRLFLSNISTLIFAPEKRINVIIGRGGSGKSSTLLELTPIPANLNKDYDDGGYKRVTITHNNKFYQLDSGFNGKNKHNFVVDGEELNTGGTRKIQLLLVKEHFGVTPFVHDIAIGISSLTTMGPQQRKNWITDISNVDYEYGIDFYNRAKQRKRDLTGAIKLEQRELILAKNKLMDTRLLETNKKTVEHLKTMIKNLSEMKNDIPPIIETKIITEEYISKVRILNKRLTKLPNIDDATTHIALKENELSNVSKKLTTNKKILSDLTYIEDIDTGEDIVGKIDMLYSKIKQLVTENNVVGMDIDNIREIYTTYNLQFNMIHDALVNIKENISGDLWSNHKKTYELVRVNLIDNIRYTEEQIQRSEELIVEHNALKHDDACVCKSCGVLNYRDYDSKKHKVIEETLTRDKKKLDEYTVAKGNHDIIYDKMSDVSNSLSVLREMKSEKNNGILYDIYREILDIDMTSDNIVKVIKEHMVTKTKLYNLTEYDSIKEEYKTLLKDKEIFDNKIALKKEHFNANRDSMERLHMELVKEEHQLKEEIKRTKEYDILSTKIMEINLDIDNHFRDSKDNYLKELDGLRNEHLNKLIGTIGIDLSKLESDIIESDYNHRSVIELETKIQKMNHQLLAVDTIVTTMSPSNGLLAKSITDFINGFIADMNTVIDRVWNYDMEILPVQISDDSDLDYKFRIKVDSRNIIEDVSKTSSSMREIVDLAFKIVSMKFLKMEDYPLYLDEFGKSFDPQHVTKAYGIIDTLSDSNFNQIFIITHSENTYSRFGDKADISVLDSANLIISNDITTNKVMKTL